MRKLSEKQIKTINIAKWFRPENSFNLLDNDIGIANRTYYKLINVQEGEDGISPEEAFLMRTEKGKNPNKVTSLYEFLMLLVGHNSAARQVKAWSEGFREGTLFKSDFEDEPEYIKNLVEMAYQGGKSDKYDYVYSFGFTEYSFEIVKILEQLKKESGKQNNLPLSQA